MHKNIIERTFDIISAAYYPTHVSPKNFSMRFSNQAFDEILQATISVENPYIEYFEELIKKLDSKKYDIVGFSIIALSQIIPSFTLITLLKKEFPYTKIVIGGQVFNGLEENIKHIPKFFEYVNYLILGEGETPLLTLMEYLSGKREITEVPNLLFYDRQENKVVETCVYHRENIQNIPVPDYKGLSLSKYLSPFPVLSYQPARGCYWSKCTFCNQFLIAGKGLRCKRIDQIVEDLQYLSETYNTCYISIINESLPPKMLNKIAQLLINKQMQIKWYAGARFDKNFDLNTLHLLKQSGCEKLYFGLESGDQKVLKEMNKGTNIEVIRRVLRDTKEVGIGVHLFIMIGFPTETLKELQSSKGFILEILDYIDRETFSYYTSIYQLKPLTPIFNEPGVFNIKKIFRKETYDLEYLYGFEREDSFVDCNYDKTKKELEETIDNLISRKQYPENIVHFMTFKNKMKKYSFTPVNSKLCINPYLVWRNFKHYNSKPAYLLYDFIYDNLYEVSNRRLWRILSSAKEPLTVAEFKKLLSEKLELSDDNLVHDFIIKMLDDNILVRR
jgi:radical SAM superfamily enzyme YgiQ (UPF0313 family)